MSFNKVAFVVTTKLFTSYFESYFMDLKNFIYMYEANFKVTLDQNHFSMKAILN